MGDKFEVHREGLTAGWVLVPIKPFFSDKNQYDTWYHSKLDVA